MTEFVHLVGTEQVQVAASRMKEAADNMRNAAETMRFALETHQRWADDWLLRLEEVLKAGK